MDSQVREQSEVKIRVLKPKERDYKTGCFITRTSLRSHLVFLVSLYKHSKTSYIDKEGACIRLKV